MASLRMDSSTHKSLVVFFSHISQTADLKRLQSVLVQFFTSNRSIISFIMSEVISCDGTKESVEECKTIAEQYLEHAVMLVSTMDSELKVYK